jgi:gamma-glutamyltranspeptidase
MTQSWRATAGSPFTAEKQSTIALRGMVTCNHPLASAAGAPIGLSGGPACKGIVGQTMYRIA